MDAQMRKRKGSSTGERTERELVQSVPESGDEDEFLSEDRGVVAVNTAPGSATVPISQEPPDVNPFWSETARAEVALQRARPADLDGVAQENLTEPTEMCGQSAGASSSGAQLSPVEMHGPVGQPIVYGPSSLPATAGTGAPQAKPRKAKEHGQPPQTFASPGEVCEQEPGLRPGERMILTQMKDMTAQLMEQNRQLQAQQAATTAENSALRARLERLEDEAMQSAASGEQHWFLEEGDRDKVWWNLPTLQPTHADSDPATRASDWLELIKPSMADLAPSSALWWNEVEQAAKGWYRTWTEASAMERGAIVPTPPEHLRGEKYQRLESRAFAMLQAALPSLITEELVSSRTLHCVGAIYNVLRLYQPGGLAERTKLLDLLANPGGAKGSSDAVARLRQWQRALNRAESMGVSIPDASIMLRGLDVLSEPVLRKHVQVSFRCSGARTVLQLDHRPTLVSLKEFVKVLLSEFEMLSVSGEEEQRGGKPRVAAVDAPKGGKGSEKGDKVAAKDAIATCSMMKKLRRPTGGVLFAGPSLRLAAFQVEPSLDTPMFSESVLGQLASAMAKIKTGLLDGGATHALRQGTAKEISRSEKTVVNLALGSAELYLSPTGVLLSVSPVSPIAPLGALVKECGCQVTWVEDMCKVWHPKHGWLKVQMQQNTPHVDESTCLMLIKELENLRTERMMRALYVKALALGQKIPDDLDPHVRSWLDWLRQLSPEEDTVLIFRTFLLYKVARDGAQERGGDQDVMFVGVFGVPLYEDGRPQYLEKVDSGEPRGDSDFDFGLDGYHIPPEWVDDAADDGAGVDAPGDWWENGYDDHDRCDDAGVVAEGEAEEDGDPLEPDPSVRERSHERWKATIAQLKKPVKIVPVVYVQPLPRKSAAVVLKGLQRMHTAIKMHGMEVRRIHADNGREFQNEGVEAWCVTRDIGLTFSVALSMLENNLLLAPRRRICGKTSVANLSIGLESEGESTAHKTGEPPTAEALGVLIRGSEGSEAGVIAIAAYTANRHESLTEVDQQLLVSLGFPVPKSDPKVSTCSFYRLDAHDEDGEAGDWVETAGWESNHVDHYLLRRLILEEQRFWTKSYNTLTGLGARGLKEEQGGNAYAASTSLEMPEWPIEDELGSIFDVHGTLKIVACGNFCNQEGRKTREHRQSLYAGGLDALTLRAQLRHCGLKATEETPVHDRWVAGKKIIVRPPSILIRSGLVCHDELWEAEGAIYGLEESPAAWAKHRDERLSLLEVEDPLSNVAAGDSRSHVCDATPEPIHPPQDVPTSPAQRYKLRRAKSDPNVWFLVRVNEDGSLDAKIQAVLGIYVDDLLATGPKRLVQALFAAVSKEWRISAPSYSDEDTLTFCGLEVRQTARGLHLTQAKYIQELLNRYSHIVGTSTVPVIAEPQHGENLSADLAEPAPELGRLRVAQKLAGELLWVSSRTRPDLAFGVSLLGQRLTKHTEASIEAGHQMIKYLRGTQGYEIIYGEPGQGHGVDDVLAAARTPNLLELFADASFCPGSDRSQTGIVMQWGNAPIGWLSLRQSTASLSTAEAELGASIDAMVLGGSVLSVLAELSGSQQEARVYTDNVGACNLLTMPNGSWRTRHLRLRAAWFVQKAEGSPYRVSHIPGEHMLGDLLTKPLLHARIVSLLQKIGLQLHTPPTALKPGEISGHRVVGGGESLSSVEPVPNGATYGGVPQPPSVLAKALKALTVATQLKALSAKAVRVEITEDESNSESSEVIHTLKLLVTVFAVVGASLLIWCCRSVGQTETPTLQRAFVEESDDDWSVVAVPSVAWPPPLARYSDAPQSREDKWEWDREGNVLLSMLLTNRFCEAGAKHGRNAGAKCAKPKAYTVQGNYRSSIPQF
ncbi:RE1 [Symbiodinium natans]|uniref:RE1 protein n=1 Tax=Symbiodinium natans TaxID=878477 RepID=A0A812LIU0_9DINO|nr:RE1 [Symbiodinium natans]